MELLFQYYDLILIVVVALVGLGYGIYKFVSTPSAQQKEILRTILLQLVVQAEVNLGSGTGKIKFSYVYSQLLQNFTWLKYIPLSIVERLIEDALEEMRHLLESNPQVKLIVEGDE